MKYKMTKWYTLSFSAEVEAESLEEAKELFYDAEWYEDEPQDLERVVYSEYNEEYDEWNVIED